jgi:rubredoxin
MPDRVGCSGAQRMMERKPGVRAGCQTSAVSLRRLRHAIPPSSASAMAIQTIIAVCTERTGRACAACIEHHNIAEYDLKKYMCLICGWVYDEATGAPDEGIAPGTKWEDVPPNWTCPECGARKEDFEMIEL